mgnify:CR=1 FL=1
MKLDELAKQYGLLLDEEGNYYRIDELGMRQEPFTTISVIGETIGLSVVAIFNRIKKAGLTGTFFKNWQGRLFLGYNLNQVYRLCSDLLSELTMANDEGIAEINGRNFTTLYRLANSLELSESSISRRIKRAGILPILAKARSGITINVYDVEQVRQLCLDLLANVPIVNSQGIATVDNRVFASISRMSKLLGISDDTITSRIAAAKVSPISAKMTAGGLFNVYDIELVKQACAELLTNISNADGNNIIMISGQPHCSISQIGKLLKISGKIIGSRLIQAKVDPISAKATNGRLISVYSLERARQVCSDLLEEKITADASGTAVIDGRTYTSIHQLGKILNISDLAIKNKIKKENLLPIMAKHPRGKVLKIYDIEQIRTICKDLLMDRLMTDAKGRVIINERAFTSLVHLVKILGIAAQTISLRITDAKIIPCAVKSQNGNLIDVYDIDLVKKACRGLIENLHKIDDQGIVNLNGNQFASIDKLCDILNISGSAINRRITNAKLSPLSGKSRNGNPINLWDIEQVRQLCLDIIDKKRNKPR